LIHLSQKGLFITLYDIETLKLYLNKGIYGQHLPPHIETRGSKRVYYRTMADYACCREGDHVFFFLKRKIYYGGQIKGEGTEPSFFVNGNYGPIGRKANAQLVWDESIRTRYKETKDKGIFIFNETERCQHFLIRFEDNIGIQGNFITSDVLYFELGRYPYPLPSISIMNMGFCIMTPGETRILLNLLTENNEGTEEYEMIEDVKLQGKMKEYSTSFSIQDLHIAEIEAQLEATIIANPNLLPDELKPLKMNILRQVPISPFKSYQMDRADVCYYGEQEIAEGTLPNVIIELKNKQAGKGEIEQVIRYAKWLHKLRERFNIDTSNIEYYLFAPKFSKNIEKYIPNEFKERIKTVSFPSDKKQKKIDFFI